MFTPHLPAAARLSASRTSESAHLRKWHGHLAREFEPGSQADLKERPKKLADLCLYLPSRPALPESDRSPRQSRPAKTGLLRIVSVESCDEVLRDQSFSNSAKCASSDSISTP